MPEGLKTPVPGVMTSLLFCPYGQVYHTYSRASCVGVTAEHSLQPDPYQHSVSLFQSGPPLARLGTPRHALSAHRFTARCAALLWTHTEGQGLAHLQTV